MVLAKDVLGGRTGWWPESIAPTRALPRAYQERRAQVVLAEDVLGGAGEVVAIKVLRRQYAYAGQKARPAPAPACISCRRL